MVGPIHDADHQVPLVVGKKSRPAGGRLLDHVASGIVMILGKRHAVAIRDAQETVLVPVLVEPHLRDGVVDAGGHGQSVSVAIVRVGHDLVVGIYDAVVGVDNLA